jgi:hypothetical protein
MIAVQPLPGLINRLRELEREVQQLTARDGAAPTLSRQPAPDENLAKR